MNILPRRLLAVACSLLVAARAQAITPWPMANGNYFEGFGTIATWANDFASPTEATRWGSVAVNGTGTIPDGRRTTVATTSFMTTTTGGVQRGAGNLVQLSTGSTDNTSANAIDLYLDFTGRAPGTLVFDWAAAANDTGNRASSLRVYAMTNGVVFGELTNASVLNLSNNVVASGSIANISLPAGFSNCATARIRFYEFNGTGGSTGRRAKIAIDNVSVTYGLPPTAITLPVTGASNTVATLNGTVNPGSSATTAWFEWGLAPFSYTNITVPVAVGSGAGFVTVTNLLSGLTPGLIYHERLVASNAVGLTRGSDIAFGSPALTRSGAATMTNECHAAFTDPGASATGAPLAITAGGFHSLALKSDGTVAAWGDAHLSLGLSNVVAITAGRYHSLVLKADGTLTAWGFNDFGQTNIPAGLSNVVAVAAGGFHSLVLKSDGTVVAWGRNDFGQASVPVDLSNVVALAAGGIHSVALKRDGTVAAWGANSDFPIGLNNVVGIAGGFYHSLAVKSDGTVVVWGLANFGQANVPVGLSNAVAVAGGVYHSLALKSDGTVAAWGQSDFGQTNVPAGLSNVVAIAGGNYHSLALKSDGTVAAWGLADYGQTAIPSDLSNLALAVGGTFNTNNAPGIYTRVYTSSNSLGGIATAKRTIVVRDTTPPVISLLGSNPLTNRIDVPFVDPGAMALDACRGSLAVTTNSTVNGAMPGTYSVRYIATDDYGNSATSTRTVVISSVPPVVATLPATGISNTVATLNGTVNPGSSPVTVWFEWGPNGVNHTNLTASMTMGSGTNVVAVSSLLSSFTPGLIYHARLVASNALGVVRGLDVLFGTPLLTLNGAGTVTNECHYAFADPGAFAPGLSLSVAGGIYHSLAAKSDGTVAAWGDNGYGQTTIPIGLSNVVVVVGGEEHSLALKSDGTVSAWGDNSYGQTTIPMGLSTVVAIAAGLYHNLALKIDGTVVTWGFNEGSQLTPPVGLSNVVAIAGGQVHSLALKHDGTVAVWGNNGFNLNVIPAGLSNVAAIAAGVNHNLALKSNGTVVAWGRNDYGQTTIPVGLSNVAAIAAGGFHNLALKTDSTLYAWGANYYGQATVPAGLSNVVAIIAAGGHHSLAVKSDGTVVAWGYNNYGQTTVPATLGPLVVNPTVDGTFNQNNLPGTYTRNYSVRNSLGGIAIATRTIVVQDTLPPVLTLLGSNPLVTPPNLPFIDPGATALDLCVGSLAVTTNGTVNVAVDGRYPVSYIATDSSGYSTSNTRTVIVGVLPVAATLPVTGASNTVATLNGTVVPNGNNTTAWFEWGLSPFGSTNLTTPVVVGSGTNAVAVSNLLSGLTPGFTYRGRWVASNILALVRGQDELFGLPLLTLNGANTMTNECQTSLADPGVFASCAPSAIAAGDVHSMAVKHDGTVVVWGHNGNGRGSVPAGNMVAIAAGGYHNLALKSDGTVAAWGRNDEGQTNVPAGLSNVVAIAGGSFHSLALRNDGTVIAWGLNDYGQTNIPAGLRDVIAVAGGYYHNLVLKKDGTVAAWGDNSASQGTVPAGLSNVVAIAGGSFHNLALRNDGTVVAWGWNSYGQLSIPEGLSNVTSIAAGNIHSLVLRSDGSVTAWGGNISGQVSIPAGLSNVMAISAGGSHNLAVKLDGTVAAWGWNVYGQASVPVDLTALPVFAGGTFSTNNAPGVYTRTYNTSNLLGGIATATRTVVVRDTLPPVITLLGSNPLINRVDAPFVDPGAMGLDACGGSYPVNTNSTVNGAVLGTYSVSYSATDSSGNSATNTRTVVITPVPPVVTTLPATGVSNTVATLNGTITPGSFAITVWFEWGLDGGSNTNFTAPVAMDAGLSTVAVSDLLSGLSPGLIYRGRLVASNAQVVVRGLDVLFGTPVIMLNSAATVTNECHASFADPGAFAPGAPLAIAAGALHSLVLKSDGTVAVWGRTNQGRTTLPVGLSNVASIAGGDAHSLALKSDGTLIGWGDNGFGQTTIPAGLSNVVAIAAGNSHSLALKSNGTVAAWGFSRYLQTTIPVGLSNVVAIAGGAYHSLALKNDGTVAAWGENYYGQIAIPKGLSNVTAVAAGGFHSLALRSNGTVAAWGYNADGQTTVPAGLNNVVAISAGGSNSLALRSDGTVVAWGSNLFGQTNTPAGLSNAVAVAAGGYHSLVLKRDGTVAAWGAGASNSGSFPNFGQSILPAGLSTRAVIVGEEFNTNSSPSTYTLTYLSSNSIGGIATATRTIVVQDTTPPVITLLGSNTLTLLTNTLFVDPGATALDACNGSFVVATSGTVNVAVPGTYAVSYVATDSTGHSATNTRTVFVVAAPPRIISPVRLGNGALQFAFTNQSGVGFTVWSSTNVALPFAQWNNLGAPVESPAGTFLFTDPQPTNKAPRFFRVSSP